jgi:hypothetical protein
LTGGAPVQAFFDNRERIHGGRFIRDRSRALTPSQTDLREIVATRKETCAMSAKRASIAHVMIVVALAAVNLAFLRAVPVQVSAFPTVLVLLGSIDFLIFWKLTLKRSLRAFHYTFLIVYVIAFFVMANFLATERLQLLGPFVRWYQQHSSANTISISPGFLWIGELWMACFLSFTLACSIGLVAASLEKRRDWDIAAILRGALVGLGIASLLATISHAVWGGAEPSSVLIGNRVISGVCLVLGGRMGLSWLKSSRPGQVCDSGKTEVSP